MVLFPALLSFPDIVTPPLYCFHVLVFLICSFLVITSFTQTPNGTVAPDTLITFTCQAVRDATWYAGGRRLDRSNSDYTVDYNMPITLNTMATVDKNGTFVTCFVSSPGTMHVTRTSKIIIAGKTA